MRKAKYIADLYSTSKSVMLVSAADKLQNTRAILADFREHGDKVFERFKKSKHETLWYYRTLANTYKQLSPGPLGDELDRTVATLEEAVSGNGSPDTLVEKARAYQHLDQVLAQALAASRI